LRILVEHVANETIKIDKEAASYINVDDNNQIVDKIKLKGSISKIDKKAHSGYVDLGSKRIPFNYPKDLSFEQFNSLVLSLRTGVAIYLYGSGILDMEGTTKALNIIEVEEDKTLFT
jgi:hypothetical protein